MFLVNKLMTRKIMMQNAELIARSLTGENIYRIEGILSNIERMSNNAAVLIETNSLSEKERIEYFKKQILSNNEIIAISVTFTPEWLSLNKREKSVIYYHTDVTSIAKDISSNVTEYVLEDWFIIPLSRRKAYWSEPWIDVKTGTQPITSYSVPIKQEEKIIGVIRTDISLKVLQSIVSSVRFLKTGYAILLSRNGTFVTHPADSLILNYTMFSYANQIESKTLHDVGKEMIKGMSNFVQLPRDGSNPIRWIYYAPIKLNKWSLGIIFRDKEILGDLNKVNYIFGLILGFGLLLMLASIYTRISTIFKPLDSLVKASNKIGSGDFDVQLPDTKMKNEVSLLTDSFSKMQSELKTYMNNLVKTNKEKEKIASEIRIAAQIQQRIIPSDRNLLSDVKEVRIFGILEPAEDIGGDLYDAFTVGNNKICFLIADVFGKGIVASMIMTMVQTLVRSQSKYTNSAVSLVKEVNSYLCENNKQSYFLTMIVCFLDLKTGTLEFCNAGHTPLYLRKENQQCIRFGETHSTALGIFPDLKVVSETIKMDAQDMVVLYTDGVTEAINEQEVFFGYSRLEGIISELQNPTPETIVKAILNGVREFSGQMHQDDDLSILVLKFNHPRLG